MLPNTKGIDYTKGSMVCYTVVLSGATLLPYFLGGAQSMYLFGVLSLDGWFLYHVIAFYRDPQHKGGMRVFMVSIYFLMLLFVLLLADHYFPLTFTSLFSMG